MEKLCEILKGIKPEIDFETENNLIDDSILDSIDIVQIIAEIEERYGIVIDPDDIDPDNFQSIDSINSLINKYLV